MGQAMASRQVWLLLAHVQQLALPLPLLPLHRPPVALPTTPLILAAAAAGCCCPTDCTAAAAAAAAVRRGWAAAQRAARPAGKGPTPATKQGGRTRVTYSACRWTASCLRSAGQCSYQ